MVFNVVRSVVVVVVNTAVLVVFFAIVLKDLVVLLTSELMAFIVLDISVQLGVQYQKRQSVRMTAPSGSLSLEARRGPLH